MVMIMMGLTILAFTAASPIINAPTILKNIIFIINNIVIGIASLYNIYIVIPKPIKKSAIDTNSLEAPIIEIKGCTGLNKILSNSPLRMYLGPISNNSSKQYPDIPIEILVTPYNSKICSKLHPTIFSVF